MAFVAVAVLMAGSFLASQRNPKYVLLVAVFMLPWLGVAVDLGLRVSAFLAIWVPLAAVVTFQPKKQATRLPVLAYGFILWAIASSFVQFFFLPDMDTSGGLLRSSTGRAIAQIAMFLITVSAVWVVAKTLVAFEELWLVGKVYIASVACLCVLAWIQLTIYSTTGVDILPNLLLENLLGTTREAPVTALMGVEGDAFLRMNALAGEPRDLGAGIVGALVLLKIGYLQFGKGAKIIPLYVFLIVTMYFTYSSTAYAAYVATLIATVSCAYVFGARSEGFAARRAKLSFAALFGGVVLFLGLVVSGGEGRGNVMTVIHERTIGRLVAQEAEMASYYHEDFDIAIIEMLLDNPLAIVVGAGLGNAHLHAGAYLPPIVATYAENTAFVAKRGYLRWVSEIGVVGVAIFLLWIATELRKSTWLIRTARWSTGAVSVTASLAVTVFVAYLVSGQFAYHLFVALGALWAVNSRLTSRGQWN